MEDPESSDEEYIEPIDSSKKSLDYYKFLKYTKPTYHSVFD